jgi:hypothetical protein
MVKKSKTSPVQSLFTYLHNGIQSLNNSKIFAGLMIITLNIVSKFVNIKLGKTLESYLKFSFSRQILIFAIAWIGTRDIYIALFITFFFVLLTEFLLHEDSHFFILSKETKEHYCNLLDNPPEIVSEEDIKKANDILERAKKQDNKEVDQNDPLKKSSVNIQEKIRGNDYDMSLYR